MSIILPSRFNRQPHQVVPVDRSDVGRTLASAIVPTTAPVLLDLVSGIPLTDPFGPSEVSFNTHGFKEEGRFRSSKTGSYRNTGVLTANNTQRYTTINLFRPLSLVTSKSAVGTQFSAPSSWQLGSLFLGDGTQSRIVGETNNNLLASRVISDVDYEVGKFYIVAYTADLLSGEQRLFVNGIKQTGIGTYTTGGTNTNPFSYTSITNLNVAEFYGSLFFTSILSDSNISKLSRTPTSPWQVFKAAPRRLYVPSSDITGVIEAISPSISLAISIGSSIISGYSQTNIPGLLANASLGTTTNSGASIVNTAGVTILDFLGIVNSSGSSLTNIVPPNPISSVLGTLNTSGHSSVNISGVLLSNMVGTSTSIGYANTIPSGVLGTFSAGHIALVSSAYPLGVFTSFDTGQPSISAAALLPAIGVSATLDRGVVIGSGSAIVYTYSPGSSINYGTTLLAGSAITSSSSIYASFVTGTSLAIGEINPSGLVYQTGFLVEFGVGYAIAASIPVKSISLFHPHTSFGMGTRFIRPKYNRF